MKKYYLLLTLMGLAMLIGHGMASKNKSSNSEERFIVSLPERKQEIYKINFTLPTFNKEKYRINSEPIKFTKEKYEVSVFENATVGKCILKINEDIGTYYMHNYTVNDTLNFSTSKNCIVISQKLDSKKTKTHYLNITSISQKKKDEPINNVSTKLIIHVIDVSNDLFLDNQDDTIDISEKNVNDEITKKKSAGSMADNCISKNAINLKRQKFSKLVYEFSILENTNVGSCMVKINSSYKKIWYTVNDTSTFAILNNNSIIFHRALDYEKKTVYYLNLTANVQEKENETKIKQMTTKLIIRVIDVNDEWPDHIQDKDILISENNPIGAHIMRVNATDKDISNEFNQITYTLKNNYEFFKIDNKTGNVTTLIEFDYEKEKYYVLNIMASDNSPTDLFKNGLSNTISYKIRIVDENDNSPKFENSSYNFKFLENTIVGSCPFAIKAFDIDETSKIKYTIISRTDDKLFKIDETTGDICLNKDLTDDNILRTFNLTVDAFDGKFHDNTTVSITVEDINNNIPVFKDLDHPVKIFKNQSVGSIVMTVNAIDADKSNKIKYRFGNDETKFSINETTGEIKTLIPLDMETQTNFSLLVIASDDSPSTIQNDGKPNEVKKYYNIEIDDENYNAPKFENLFNQFVVLENTTVGSCPFAIQASDEDETSQIKYNITSRTDDDSFRIDESTGAICLNKNLTDDNILRTYNLTVDAFDGKFHNNTTVSITIEDINNNIPVFKDFDQPVKIFKNQSIGSVVMTVNATDADKSNKIKYRFGNDETKFSINETTGEIKTLVPLDKETQTNFSLLVIASDDSPSANENNGKPNEVEQYYNIEIDDENYNAPKFENSVYQFVILENTTVGSCPFAIEASDKDETSQIKYTITSRTDDDLFRINESTGAICLNKNLTDDNILRTFNLTVDAFDGKFHDNTTVSITVEDINNNIPVFKDLDHPVKIFKNQSVGSIVMTVNATDADKSNKIKYRFGNDETKFSINETTGEIKTLVPLDMETQTNFSLLVIASDDSPSANENNGKPNEVEQYYTIEIDDENYNAPKFENSVNQFVILENTSIENCSITIRASDKDKNSEIKYTIISSADDELFRINELTGDICLNKNLTNDNILRTFNLTVDAFDGKFHDKTTVSIIIEDINNNKPIFEDIQGVKILKNQTAGSVVMTVHATDADKSSQNNEIEYTLGNNETNFSIDKKTGEVKILPAFDREAQTNISLLVIASDNSPSAITNDGKPNEVKQYYNILIDDEDDSAINSKRSFSHSGTLQNTNEKKRNFTDFIRTDTLVFDKLEYHVTIYRNDNVGKCPITVKVYHNSTNSKITYSIISGNENKTFKIDDSTGAICIDQALDRISVDSYSLTVKASDGIYDDKTIVLIEIKTPIIIYIIIIIIIIILALLLAGILYILYQKLGQASGKYNIWSRMKATSSSRPLV